MTPTPAPTRLWNKNFISYWLGIAAAALGDALIFVALPFLVLELSDNPQALATAVLLGSLPRFAGPVVGLLADKLHLKVPLLVIGVARATIFASLGVLALGDTLTLSILYTAGFLNGLLTVFVFSAGNVLLPKLVPETQLSRANSLMQSAIMGLPLAGYGLAGILVASIGTALTIVVAAPLFILLSAAALIVRFPTPAPTENSNVFADLSSGIQFLFNSTIMRLVVVASLFLNLTLSALNILMPLGMQDLGRGAQGYGVFESVLSGSILLGIGLVSLVGQRIRLNHQIGAGIVVLGLGLGALSPGDYSFLLAGASLIGLGLGFSQVASITLLQLIIPDGARGKVLGTLLMFNAVGLSLGAIFAGQSAERVGLTTLYLIGAGLALATALLWTIQTASFKLEPTNTEAVTPQL